MNRKWSKDNFLRYGEYVSKDGVGSYKTNRKKMIENWVLWKPFPLKAKSNNKSNIDNF